MWTLINSYFMVLLFLMSSPWPLLEEDDRTHITHIIDGTEMYCREINLNMQMMVCGQQGMSRVMEEESLLTKPRAYCFQHCHSVRRIYWNYLRGLSLGEGNLASMASSIA